MRWISLLGFLYELRRTLLSPALILTMALVVGSSFGVLAALAESSQVSDTTTSQALYYFEDGQVHVLAYSFDSFGRPVPGVSFSVAFYPASGVPSGTPTATVAGVTSNLGMASLETALPDAAYTVDLSFAGSSASGSVTASTRAQPEGVVAPLYGGFTSVIASGTGFSATPRLQVFFAGVNGSVPEGYQVYWAGPTSAVAPSPLPESEMTSLGDLAALHETYDLTVPGATTSSVGRLQVEIFTSSGQLVAQDVNQSAATFAVTQSGTRATTVALSFVTTILGFFVPVLAILAAYSTFGKDRVTSVYEGALCRPVSWLGLALSRYMAVMVALTVSTAAAIGVIDGLLGWALGSSLSGGVAALLFGSVLVEAGAFGGLVFVIAYVARSSGTLVGVAVGLWALLGLAWNTISVDLAILLGNPAGTPAFESAVTALDFCNPADFIQLAQSLVQGSVGGVPAASLGLTPANLASMGILWVAVPLVLLIYLVQTRD